MRLILVMGVLVFLTACKDYRCVKHEDWFDPISMRTYQYCVQWEKVGRRYDYPPL
jgi:hypothetical protein